MTKLKDQLQTVADGFLTSGSGRKAFHLSYEAPPQRSPYGQGVTHTLAMVMIATVAVTILFG